MKLEQIYSSLLGWLKNNNLKQVFFFFFIDFKPSREFIFNDIRYVNNSEMFDLLFYFIDILFMISFDVGHLLDIHVSWRTVNISKHLFHSLPVH